MPTTPESGRVEGLGFRDRRVNLNPALAPELPIPTAACCSPVQSQKWSPCFEVHVVPIITIITESQMEKKMEKEMEAGII